jgi:tetratricopeptide (TPR) repeat protein
MDLVLERWPSRILVAAAAAAVTASLSLDLWKHVQADRLAREGSITSLEQAVRLEPRNAELHWRLGRAELFSEGGSAAAAVASLTQATTLNPAVGAYWVDLARAQEGEGNNRAAASGLERARAAEPRTPEILWESMNFALRDGQPEQALSFARQLLAAAPPYTGRVLDQLAPVAGIPELIARVVPADRGALDVVADYIWKHDDVASADMLWARVIATDLPPSAGQLRALIDSLIRSGQGPLAEHMWTDSIRRGWIPGDVDALAEPLYNSDLRRPLLGFGFDWKVLPQEETSVWVSDEGPQPGEPCLCADFSARARADFAHITHAVPVIPGQSYLLTAKMRVRHVVTPAGAYLAVYGFGTPGVRPATTDPMLGSTGWQEVSTQFVAGAQTRIAQVVLARPGSSEADTPASGQVCLAEVQWKRLSPAADYAPGHGRSVGQGVAR